MDSIEATDGVNKYFCCVLNPHESSIVDYANIVTEKKQRSVDCAEATKKTVQAMRNEWWGFFYKNTGYIRHNSNKFGSALACSVFALRSCP